MIIKSHITHKGFFNSILKWIGLKKDFTIEIDIQADIKPERVTFKSSDLMLLLNSTLIDNGKIVTTYFSGFHNEDHFLKYGWYSPEQVLPMQDCNVFVKTSDNIEMPSMFKTNGKMFLHSKDGNRIENISGWKFQNQ